MEHCREGGLCKSIGVMNCPVVMFLEILTFCHKKPAINCLESHPYFTQDEAINFYKKLGVPVAAYAPLAPSENCKFMLHEEKLKGLDLLKESLILELAKKYNKSAAQIVFNWHLRKHHIMFLGMQNKEQLESDADIFDFELSKEDIEKINGLNRDARFYECIQDVNFNFIPYWQ